MLMARHLREIRIQQGEMLEEPGRSVDAVYFPRSGMISLIVQMPEDSSVEVGTVGSEGAVGMAAGLGSRVSFICALVQVSGSALCIPASRFRAAAGQSERIRDLIVTYSELQLGQIQQTAACNALHDVSGRLCRWLLQTSDKIESDTIPFTHEFLASMLGVRRPTVSQIASELGCRPFAHRSGPNQAAQSQGARDQSLPLLEDRSAAHRSAAPSDAHLIAEIGLTRWGGDSAQGGINADRVLNALDLAAFLRRLTSARAAVRAA